MGRGRGLGAAPSDMEIAEVALAAVEAADELELAEVTIDELTLVEPIDLPAGSTLDGSPIGGGDPTGEYSDLSAAFAYEDSDWSGALHSWIYPDRTCLLIADAVNDGGTNNYMSDVGAVPLPYGAPARSWRSPTGVAYLDGEPTTITVSGTGQLILGASVTSEHVDVTWEIRYRIADEPEP